MKEESETADLNSTFKKLRSKLGPDKDRYPVTQWVIKAYDFSENVCVEPFKITSF